MELKLTKKQDVESGDDVHTSTTPNAIPPKTTTEKPLLCKDVLSSDQLWPSLESVCLSDSEPGFVSDSESWSDEDEDEDDSDEYSASAQYL